MREFEREAMRIAIVIEGEETQDLHLAEERGFDLHDNFDIDEEMRFSSVLRGRGFDDSGYEEEEDIMLDSHNIETFGDSSDSHSRRSADLTSLQGSVGVRIPSSSSLVDNIPPFLATINLNRSDFNDQARWLASELPSKSFPISDSESRCTCSTESKMICLGNTEEAVMLKNLLKNNLYVELQSFVDKQINECEAPYFVALTSINDSHLRTCNCQILLVSMLYYLDSHSLLDDKIDASDKAGPCEKCSFSREPSEGPASSKVIGETHSANSHGQPGSCASSNSDCVAAVSASSGPGLSPSSSMGSLSSKKSTLNPHAKEFKLNPNAKSFIPSQTAARPPTPVSDGSFYYQPQMSPVPHMHMPVSFGLQYGQQTLLGQRQVVYYQP
ncbi:hypothetical protein Goshw_015003, partial [Gossypium schwendimanii]|nr:hypothetical protein [Gossypium schwendimanii]